MAAKTKELPFETKMERLQEIVSSLEQGKVSLAESIALYKEGLQHSQKCREELEKARHEIQILSQGQWEDFNLDLVNTQNYSEDVAKNLENSNINSDFNTKD